MKYLITSKNETAQGFTITAVGVTTSKEGDKTDYTKQVHLTGLSKEEADKFTISQKISVS